MNVSTTDKINQESYDKIVEMLLAYNQSKTQEFKDAINTT